MVNTIPAFQSGLAGIQSGLDKLNGHSATIANKDSLESGSNVNSALIGLISDKQQIQASAKAIETSNATLGTLLDISV